MSTFYIKQGDTLPRLRATLSRSDGTAIDLTTAVSVSMRMRGQGSASVLVKSAAIITAASGIVEVTWSVGDTATAGAYDAEFEITFADGVQSVPTDSFLTVIVSASF
jgi:hypothetical protein